MTEGYFGPLLYGRFAAKETLSRNWLAENGASASEIAAIPQGEAFQFLLQFTGGTETAMTDMLYQANNVGSVWYLMAVFAIGAVIGLFFYGRWIAVLTRPGAATVPATT